MTDYQIRLTNTWPRLLPRLLLALDILPGRLSKLSCLASFILFSFMCGISQMAIRPKQSPRSSSLVSRSRRPNSYVMTGVHSSGYRQNTLSTQICINILSRCHISYSRCIISCSHG